MKINLENINEGLILELAKEPNIREILEREGVIKSQELLELNRWIKDDNYKVWMVYFTENCRYGINAHGEWFNIDYLGSLYHDKNNRYATPEEVETALINEAKRRRYANGITCLFGDVREKRTLQSDVLKFHINLNIITCGGDVIFKNGKWAEIVTETLTIEQKIKILKAEDFYNKKDKDNLPMSFNEKMIEFAKMHVQAALKAASEKASVYADEGGYSEFVDEHSILNSYPESNIK